MRLDAVGMAIVLMCVACKVVPSAPNGGSPVAVVLPPGEEFIPPSTRDFQAEALAEPLQPDAESAADMSPKDLRDWENAVRFGRGEAVDFDGDGYKESVGKWVDGHFTSTHDRNADGIPDETYDGTRDVEDTDFDGRPNRIVTTTLRPNGGTKMVEETDTDGDGILDERYTEERLAPHKERRLMERLQDGVWTVEYDEVGSTFRRMTTADLTDAEMQQCANEFPQRFPSDLSGPVKGTKGVKIPYGREGESHRCPKEAATKVDKALQCVRKKVDSCLSPLNPTLADKLRRFLAGEKQRDDNRSWQTYVSCSGTCEAAGGITERDENAHTAKIELPTDLLFLSDQALCERLFHELLHGMGLSTGWHHDTLGSDRLYSCARVCSGCSHDSIGSGDDHLDCARCADPAPNKQLCGTKPVVTTRSLIDSPPSCGYQPALAPYQTASCSRKEVILANCDNTKIPDTSSWCCENGSCPPGFSIEGSRSSDGWCNSYQEQDIEMNTCQGPLWLCDV